MGKGKRKTRSPSADRPEPAFQADPAAPPQADPAAAISKGIPCPEIQAGMKAYLRRTHGRRAPPPMLNLPVVRAQAGEFYRDHESDYPMLSQKLEQERHRLEKEWALHAGNRLVAEAREIIRIGCEDALPDWKMRHAVAMRAAWERRAMPGTTAEEVSEIVDREGESLTGNAELKCMDRIEAEAREQARADPAGALFGAEIPMPVIRWLLDLRECLALRNPFDSEEAFEAGRAGCTSEILQNAPQADRPEIARLDAEFRKAMAADAPTRERGRLLTALEVGIYQAFAVAAWDPKLDPLEQRIVEEVREWDYGDGACTVERLTARLRETLKGSAIPCGRTAVTKALARLTVKGIIENTPRYGYQPRRTPRQR